MEKLDVLNKYYDRACHNLFCYSRNYLMTEAKQGYENEWREALEECEILQSMIKSESNKVNKQEMSFCVGNTEVSMIRVDEEVQHDSNR